MSADQVHRPAYSRTIRGHSPIKGGGTFYATVVRCACGWRKQVNQAPSKGGRRFAQELHAQHVQEATTWPA